MGLSPKPTHPIPAHWRSPPSHLLSCPTFCFNFLFFLYLRPLQPDLYGSQMCTGKLPEVRHRPKRSLHPSASLRCHSTALAGSCVCSRFCCLAYPTFSSLTPNSSGPCHAPFCRDVFGGKRKKKNIALSWDGKKGNLDSL